jgi:hypothetical protein
MWVGGTSTYLLLRHLFYFFNYLSKVLGIIRLVIDVKKVGPSSIFNAAVVVRLGTAYYALTLSQTLLVTSLIVGKLMYVRSQAAKVLMNVDHYISASTILLESSMLYAVFALVLLVL